MSQRRDQFAAIVSVNQSLCREHFRLVLRLRHFPPSRPGQFVQIACRQLGECYSPEHEMTWQEGRPLDPKGKELMAPLALLRRPFSLAGRRDTAQGVELELIHRVVGVGTGWLERLREGDEVGVLGPLGNGFVLPAENGPAILVGGGVGIPPMLYLAGKLAGRKAVAFCGATTRDLLALTVTDDAPAPSSDRVEPLYNIEEFSRHGVPAVITTDDGSYGFRGFVTQALEAYLESFIVGSRRLAVGSIPSSPSSALPIIYACGPEGMMKRVAEIALERGIECQVAVERAMACGMGTCQSCVIRIRSAEAARGWVYKLACTDGPVFRAAELLW